MQVNCFSTTALAAIKLGFQITPLRPRTKIAFLPELKSSRDPKQIEHWAAQYPDSNVGCVAHAEIGEPWPLDMDCPLLWTAIEEETGQTFPNVLMVRSSSPCSFDVQWKWADLFCRMTENPQDYLSPAFDGENFHKLHAFFSHNDGSIALGNRKQANEGEVRGNMQYVVGLGSIHPDTGLPYAVVNEGPIPECPAWLLDWLGSHWGMAGGNKLKPLDPSLTPENILAEVNHMKDTVRAVLQWDAEHDQKIILRNRQFVRHGKYGRALHMLCLNRDKHTKKTAADEDPGVWSTTTSILLEPSSGISHVCQHANCHLSWAWLKEQVGYPAMDEDATVMDGMRAFTPKGGFAVTATGIAEKVWNEAAGDWDATLKTESVESVEVVETEEELKDDLVLDPDELDGKLGEMAKMMGLPLNLAYTALLAFASVIPDVDELSGTRINIYAALLGPIGSGKNEAMRRAKLFLALDHSRFVANAFPGGDRQLAELIGDRVVKIKGKPDERIPGPRKLLIVTNEMDGVLKKMSIKNSTLGQTFTDLWDENQRTIQPSGGRSRINVDCRLSWIGGVPVEANNPEAFAETFGRDTSRGLSARMIFGYSAEELDFRDWMLPITPPLDPTVLTCAVEIVENEDGEMQWPELTAKAVNEKPQVIIPEQIQEAIYAWKPEGRDSRTLHNMKKVILVNTLFNGATEVTEESFERGKIWALNQIKIKSMFKAGFAPSFSLDAQFSEACISTLKRRGAVSKETSINWRRLANGLKWPQRFTSAYIKFLHNLAVGGSIGWAEDKKRIYLKQK